MTQIKDGGPAFPQQSGWNHSGDWINRSSDDEGISVRDYFAAKAMHALIASTENFTADQYAKAAYEMADAMIKARGTP